MEGIRYGLEQGVYGWEVTDCRICFEYGVYYSPVSTPADFRFLAPIVLELALKKAGTQVLEPYLSFTLFAPQEYLSRAYHDAVKYDAVIETTSIKNNEAILTGEIPAKYVYELKDNKYIETVFIKRRDGGTVCVSTQVGCPVGCIFCESGRNGFVRNLTSSEIVQQIILLRRKVNRIVFMGMGEPLFNYDSLIIVSFL